MSKPNMIDRFIEFLYLKIPNNLAIYDQLTHVFNSNWLFRLGYKKYRNKGCYITMIDLNNFKKINDIGGHILGNAILVTIAGQLCKLYNIDNTVDVCRYGGDEFLIFSSIDISSFLEADKTNIISYGVCYKGKNMSIDDTICKADGNMYKYKKRCKSTSSNDILDEIKSIVDVAI